MKTNAIFLKFLVPALLLAGCAKDPADETNLNEKEYFDAMMEYRYPEVQANENGVFILEDIPGMGEELGEEGYVYISYTVADIEGNISSTTDEKTAKQVGSYVKSYYYGPRVSATGTSLSVGMEGILEGMRAGGTRKAIVPFWLNTYTRYESLSQYLKNASSTSSTMYTVTLEEIISDETKWEIDSLETHLSRIYGAKPDSLHYGFYYYRLAEPEDEEEFPSDTTIYIDYIGRLLNGQVFDTTIKDTAIVHGIYSSSKTYSPVAIKWASEAGEIQMSGSSVISGFSSMLWNMHKFEKGISYFTSSLGYSYSGSGYVIPGCSPLSFEVEIVEKP